MARVTNIIIRSFPVMVTTALVAMVMNGCIKDDLIGCPPPVPEMEEVMIVTLINPATGEKITVSVSPNRSETRRKRVVRTESPTKRLPVITPTAIVTAKAVSR